MVPLKTREPAFDKILSYRSYRLQDIRLVLEFGELRGVEKVSARIRSYNPSFEDFDGRDAMDIIRFLCEFKDAADAMGVSEDAAVNLLPWFLRGEAKAYLAATQQKRKLLGGASRELYKAHAVHALVLRYATDNVLSKAYDEVTRITQHAGEEESDFADLLQNAALRCANVFTERDLVNYFLKGLQPGIRSTDGVILSRTDEQDLLAVRRIDQAHGETFRATRNETRYPLSATREGARKKNAMLVSQSRGDTAGSSETSSEIFMGDPHYEPTSRVLFLEGGPKQGYPPPSPGTSSTFAEKVDVTSSTPVPPLTSQQEELA